MPLTGIHTLDDSPHVAAKWIEELREAVEFEDNQRTYRLLRTTLHVLRDWLPIDEAAQLSAQLPILIRGIYYDSWNPSASVPRPHGKPAFIKRIDDVFVDAPLDDTEACVAAVFALLKRYISSGEMQDVAGSLPKDFQPLLS